LPQHTVLLFTNLLSITVRTHNLLLVLSPSFFLKNKTHASETRRQRPPYLDFRLSEDVKVYIKKEGPARRRRRPPGGGTIRHQRPSKGSEHTALPAGSSGPGSPWHRVPWLRGAPGTEKQGAGGNPTAHLSPLGQRPRAPPTSPPRIKGVASPGGEGPKIGANPN